MLSYGGVPLQLAGADESAFIASKIPIESAFGFMRPRWHGDPSLDPRSLFNWFLNRPLQLNCLYQPWGASRWGHVFCLADGGMLADIQAQNSAGQALLFSMDDSLGGAISTPLYMLPPVPLAKILGIAPQLPLHLIPLVDSRFYLWERSAVITVVEGTTTWANLYAQLISALGITLTAETVSADYLFPSNFFSKSFQPLPLLADIAAASCGQRIVRTLDGQFFARSATTAAALVMAQANAFRKYAGGSLELGAVSA